MRQKVIMILLVFTLFEVGQMQADIVELPLACEGRYDPNSPVWKMDFDLGVPFTEISHVYMDWSGEIMAGLATDPTIPGPQQFPIEVGIHAYLGRNPGARFARVSGGEATYPKPESFDCRSEFQLRGKTTWSDLLDGQGTISIGYASLGMGAGCPGSGYGGIIDFGFIALNEAIMVVEGTPVPEPATILLLAAGIKLRTKNKNMRRFFTFN